jgi:hypothetical protein
MATGAAPRYQQTHVQRKGRELRTPPGAAWLSAPMRAQPVPRPRARAATGTRRTAPGGACSGPGAAEGPAGPPGRGPHPQVPQPCQPAHQGSHPGRAVGVAHNWQLSRQSRGPRVKVGAQRFAGGADHQSLLLRLHIPHWRQQGRMHRLVGCMGELESSPAHAGTQGLGTGRACQPGLHDVTAAGRSAGLAASGAGLYQRRQAPGAAGTHSATGSCSPCIAAQLSPHSGGPGALAC